MIDHPEEIISVADRSSATPATGFRADIQAMRALAVLLVLAYHAHLPGAHAGFLGVDVFFVISGFVITNVLLKERARTAGTSLPDFYGRRIRRILPAATVVLIATLIATSHWLGPIIGVQTAGDAKWVAAFLGNFHFAAVGTNYLTANNPPSTLQQYWSLAVEEQFYLVWPLLFVGAALLARRRSVTPVLLVVLGVVIAVSLFWSIHQTPQNPVVAFNSPFTRAWELALGGLLAVTAPIMLGGPRWLGHGLRVLGFGGVLASTWFLTSASLWPGANSILPVLSAGAMVAGGSILADRAFGPVTNFAPIQWIGLISYSLYLVHWPILTIPSEYSFTALPRHSEIELALLSIAVAAVLYFAVERPLRKQAFLVERRWSTYLLGALLIAASYATISWYLRHH